MSSSRNRLLKASLSLVSIGVLFLSGGASQSTKKLHWLKIVLEGTRSNRNGLGATVRVRANGQTYTKYNDGKSGYLAQSALPLYFGLGDAAKIDEVEVVWPSSRQQILTTGLEQDRILRLSEPK